MKLPKFDLTMVKPTLKMAIPAMIESFFSALVGIVDSYMVSTLGSNSVAAIGLTTQPRFLGLSMFFATNISIAALVARRLGEKRQNAANEVLSTSLLLVITLATIISILLSIFSSQILLLCGATPETHEGATQYYQIVMGCMIFQCVSMAINAAQRGVGNTKITMRTNITSNLVNVVFNYLLIGGNFGFPALGIRGAAIATVLGTVVACIMSIASVLKKDCYVSFIYIVKNKIKAKLVALKDIIKIGYGIFLEQILIRIGFMATAIMAASQGMDSMAAHQVSMNILGLSFSFGDGLQAAAVALIGRSLGEKNPDLAKRYGKSCQFIGGTISIALTVIFFFGARPVMELFFREPEIVSHGVNIMYVAIVAILFQIRQIIYMGCLRGAGDTLYTAAISMISVTIVRTAGSYIGAYVLGLGIVGIWLGIATDQLCRFIFSSIRFKAGKWIQIKI